MMHERSLPAQLQLTPLAASAASAILLACFHAPLPGSHSKEGGRGTPRGVEVKHSEEITHTRSGLVPVVAICDV